MSDNYLIHGANALNGSLKYIHGDKFLYEPKSVQIYLSAACAALTQLIDDEETISKITAGINTQANEIYEQFQDFMEEFVKPDHALLIAAGMNERMANYLFQDLNKLDEILKRHKETNIEELKGRIQELAYSVCTEQDNIIKSSENLKKSIKVIGGGAVITTNFAADTIIGGLASTFSISFGGILIDRGLKGNG